MIAQPPDTRDQTCHVGLLLMESHGLAPNVRSTSFSSVRVWSKLFQVGPYYLDVILGPGERGLRLRGEILTEDGDTVPAEGVATLQERDGSVASSEAVGDPASSGEGTFSFDIERAGDYHLNVAFGQEVLHVAGLEVR